jgi:hypothetical protein
MQTATAKEKKATKLYQQALNMGDSPVIDKEYIMSLVEENKPCYRGSGRRAERR